MITYHITMHGLSKVGTTVLRIVLARGNDAIRIGPETPLRAAIALIPGLVLRVLNPDNLVHPSLLGHFYTVQ